MHNSDQILYFTYSKKTLEFNIVTFSSVFVMTLQIDFVMGYTGVYNIHVHVDIHYLYCMCLSYVQEIKTKCSFNIFFIIILLLA